MFSSKPPSQVAHLVRERGDPVITAWSFSRLLNFETCAYTQYLDKIKGVKQVQGEAASRGERLHKQCEDYIMGVDGEVPAEVAKMTDRLNEYRALYEEAKCEVEGDWGFTIDWEPTGWAMPNTWARIKLDVMAFESETSGIVADWKSGKRFMNEIKHNAQGQIYAIGAFMRYPKLEFIETRFHYIDLGLKEDLTNTYTREQAMRYLPRWNSRALALTTADEQDLRKPSPSIKNCKWCNFREECEYRMEG